MTKKVIQIRSFVKGGNHGQYLQALGLAEMIKSLAPESEVSHLNYNNHFWKELWIQFKGLHLIKFIAMSYFWKKNLKFTPLNYEHDVSVYGSDMIWHLLSPLFPADEIFFGKNDDASTKISYAPSVATRGENEPKWIKNYLDDFTSLGVRDYGSKEFVSNHTQREAICVVDPCFFLLESKYTDQIISTKRKREISVYGGAAYNFILKRYPELSKGYKVSVQGYYPKRKVIKYLKTQLNNPLSVVKNISESKLLITSTFHGVMMALMTKTPFIAIASPNLVARLNSPIKKVFGDFRIIGGNTKITDLTPFLDKTDLDFKYLENYIEESKAFLKDSLQIK